MKQLLTIFAVLGFTQAATAATKPHLSENFSLVEENLNKEIYNFENKIIRFALSKDNDVAQLNILNNLCPMEVGGFSCLAMPAPVLNATFNFKSAETDSCNVQTLISYRVEVATHSHKYQQRFAQIRVKDFSKSVCKIVYSSEVQVELKETTVDSKFGKSENHYSTILFNYLKH